MRVLEGGKSMFNGGIDTNQPAAVPSPAVECGGVERMDDKGYTQEATDAIYAAEADRPIRVLVVDDEPLIVQMLSIALQYEKYDVSMAGDGAEAIRQTSQVKPDLVILDWMMPNMDGIEVARRLRAAGDVAILMLTARGEDDDQVKGLESGADDYLVKPFTLPVLLNLLDNALRYTPPGGEVSVSGAIESKRVRIDVRDTGSGISEQDLPHIFERFYRGDASRTRATGNTGLGLAMARSIVEAHGGTIDVTSAPGAGARFTIHLPLVPGDAVAGNPKEEPVEAVAAR
jgi:CheY-like chemotaxis protein